MTCQVLEPIICLEYFCVKSNGWEAHFNSSPLYGLAFFVLSTISNAQASIVNPQKKKKSNGRTWSEKNWCWNPWLLGLVREVICLAGSMLPIL